MNFLGYRVITCLELFTKALSKIAYMQRVYETQDVKLISYSSVPNCREGGQMAHFVKKKPQVHLIIIRE